MLLRQHQGDSGVGPCGWATCNLDTFLIIAVRSVQDVSFATWTGIDTCKELHTRHSCEQLSIKGRMHRPPGLCNVPLIACGKYEMFQAPPSNFEMVTPSKDKILEVVLKKVCKRPVDYGSF